jgi:hypothetical protein
LTYLPRGLIVPFALQQVLSATRPGNGENLELKPLGLAGLSGFFDSKRHLGIGTRLTRRVNRRPLYVVVGRDNFSTYGV